MRKRTKGGTGELVPEACPGPPPSPSSWAIPNVNHKNILRIVHILKILRIFRVGIIFNIFRKVFETLVVFNILKMFSVLKVIWITSVSQQ